MRLRALILSAVVIFAGAASAEAAPGHPNRPLAAFPAPGSSTAAEILYRDSSGGLDATTFDGSSWGTPVATGITGLASDPSWASTGQGDNRVFWEGDNGDLWSATTSDGTSFQNVSDTQIPTGLDPSAIAYPVSTGKWGFAVFWVEANGGIYAAVQAPGSSSWTGPSNLGLSPAQNSPGIVMSGNGTADSANFGLFWEGGNGDLFSAFTGGGPTAGWGAPADSGIGGMDGPDTAIQQPGGPVDNFFVGSDGGLWETIANGSSFSAAQELSAGPLAGGPTVTNADSQVELFWEHTGGTLYEQTISSSGAATVPAGPGTTTVPPAASGTTPATPAPPSTGATTIPPSTPAPNGTKKKSSRPHVRVHLVIYWQYRARRTRVHKVTLTRLPADPEITMSCTGPHCPPTAHFSGAKAGRQFVHALLGRWFAVGDRLTLTFAGRGKVSERVRATIRSHQKPLLERVG